MSVREPLVHVLSAATCFDLAPGVMLQDAEDGAILLNLHAETIYALNATGARAVTLLVAGLPIGPVVDRLVHEYQADAAEVVDAVSALVAALTSAELLIERRLP